MQTFKTTAKNITAAGKSLTKSNIIATAKTAAGMIMGTPAGMKKWDAFGKTISTTTQAPGQFVMKAPQMSGTDWASALGTGFGWGTQAAITEGLSAEGTAVEGSTNLFRAVSESELADIGANGLRTIPGGYETSKLFATSAGDAAQFGKNNFGLDGIPNTVIKVDVPNSTMRVATGFEADGMKAVAIPTAHLSSAKFVYPMPYTPQPTNPFSIFGW